jgi:hypothetical protein
MYTYVPIFIHICIQRNSKRQRDVNKLCRRAHVGSNLSTSPTQHNGHPPSQPDKLHADSQQIPGAISRIRGEPWVAPKPLVRFLVRFVLRFLKFVVRFVVRFPVRFPVRFCLLHMSSFFKKKSHNKSHGKSHDKSHKSHDTSNEKSHEGFWGYPRIPSDA